MPILTPQEKVDSILRVLVFDRNLVAVKGEKDDEYKSQIDQAVKIIDFEETRFLPKAKDTPGVAKDISKIQFPHGELKELYWKVGLWFLFRHRKKEDALKYLTAYQLVFSTEKNKDSLRYAEVLNFIGHASTIDMQFKDPQIFLEAARVCRLHVFSDSVPKLNPEEEAERIKQAQVILAFSWRYVGLCYHRQSMTEKGARREELINKAFEYFSLSAELFAKYPPTTPNIELAESLHLLGVAHANNNDFVKALSTLEKAFAIEERYVKDCGGEHYMRLITMQSRAQNLLRLVGYIQKQAPLAVKTELDAKWESAEDCANPEGDQRIKEIIQGSAIRQTDKFLADHILEVAREILGSCYEDQLDYLEFPEPTSEFDRSYEHPDIAKTLQFSGDVALAEKHYPEATKIYFHTLQMRLNLRSGVAFTQDGLANVLADVHQELEFDPDHANAIDRRKEEKFDVFDMVAGDPDQPVLGDQDFKNMIDKYHENQKIIGEKAKFELAKIYFRIGTYNNFVSSSYDFIRAKKALVALHHHFLALDLLADNEKPEAKKLKSQIEIHIALSFQKLVTNCAGADLKYSEIAPFVRGVLSPNLMNIRVASGLMESSDIQLLAKHYLDKTAQADFSDQPRLVALVAELRKPINLGAAPSEGVEQTTMHQAQYHLLWQPAPSHSKVNPTTQSRQRRRSNSI